MIDIHTKILIPIFISARVAEGPDPAASLLRRSDEHGGQLLLREQRDQGEQDPGPVPRVRPDGLLPEPLLRDCHR